MKNNQLWRIPARTAPGLQATPRAERDFMRGDPFLEAGVASRIGPVFAPSFDLFETDEEFTLLGDLPGLGIADLDLEFTADSLIITGEREGDDPDPGASCHALERTFGSFMRRFHFPERVDGSRSLVRMRDGVLVLQVPKRAEGLPSC